MRIREIFLEGYLRLKLNRVNSVRMTPSELVQLVIGTNGSGKSSLLEQINHWPADRKDFKVGGVKEVTSDHNGRVYRTVQHFAKKSSSFEFWMDDQNLNDGGTGSVQKELIKEHFKLDQDLVDMMMGKVKFTALNPTQRRDWLTKISGMDLSYALGLHKRIASAARDVQGAKKILDKRLTNDSDGLWDSDQWESMKATSGRLSDIVTQLMDWRNPSIRSLRDVNGDFEQHVAKMNRMAETVGDKIINHDNLVCAERNLRSLTDFQEHLNVIGQDLASCEATRSHLMGELETLDKDLTDIRSKVSIDVDRWTKRKNELDQRIASLSNRHFEYDWASIDYGWGSILEELRVQLYQFFEDKETTDFIANVDVDTYNQERARITTYSDEANKAKNTIEKIKHRIRDIEEARDEECPKCKFVYKPGVSENELAELRASLVKHEELYDQRCKAITYSTEVVNTHDLKQTNLRQFRDIVSCYPAFRSLWNKLVDGDYLYNNLRTLLIQVENFIEEFKAMCAIKEQKDALLEVEDVLRKTNTDGNLSERLEQLTKREEEMAGRLQSITARMEQLSKESTNTKTTIAKAQYIEKLEGELVDMMDTFDKLCAERLSALTEAKIMEDIQLHQTKLANVSRAIQDQETKRAIVDDMKAKVGSMEEDYAAWKMLEEAMSPKTGLIADQLLGFMHSFTESLNDIIERVWAHELKVIPCNGDATNLDYKFAMQVDGSSHHVPDISVGSSGQVDMINFAFVLLTMTYLGLTDFPLYADELGASFDEEHRENLQRFLKTLLETNNCSQLWMISHAYAVQNSLGACEVCVVDKTNITVPTRYNDHVEFA